jgi:hypothetical protein
MARLALTLAIWLSVACMATASLEPRKETLSPPERIWNAQAARFAARPAPTAAGRPRFQITEQTEVLLDGKPCKYAEIPPDAVIIKMEVAEDKKTVLKIHFRSRR